MAAASTSFTLRLSESLTSSTPPISAPEPRQNCPQRADQNRASRPESFPASFTPETVGVSYLAPFDIACALETTAARPNRDRSPGPGGQSDHCHENEQVAKHLPCQQAPLIQDSSGDQVKLQNFLKRLGGLGRNSLNMVGCCGPRRKCARSRRQVHRHLQHAKCSACI